MRIALCLSGQARGVKESLPTIKTTIIDNFNCDVFAFVCNDRSLQNILNIDIDFQTIAINKDFKIDKNKEIYCESKNNGREQRYLQQLYYIYMSNKLKREKEKAENFRYDWVIRSRFDLYFDDEFPDLSIINSNCLYTPKKNSYGGLNDQFAFGSSTIMDIYSNRFYLIDKENPAYNAETLLLRMMTDSGIECVSLPIDYHIIGANEALQEKTKWDGLR